MFNGYEKKYLRRKFSFRKARFKRLLAFTILISSNLCLKKDKMIICGGPGCINRADKNSNITLLATIIIMLL